MEVSALPVVFFFFQANQPVFYVLVSAWPIHLFSKINSNKGAKILSNSDLGN